MEVVFVCPWFGVFAGGAERAVRHLARELQRRGIGVEVMTTCSDDLFGDWRRDGLPAGPGECEGLRVHRFPVAQGGLDRYRAAVHATTRRESAISRDQMYDFFRYGISSDALIDAVGALPETTHVVANPYFQSLAYRCVEAYPGRIHLLPCFHDEPEFYWDPVADMIDDARSLLFLSEEEKSLAVRRRGLHQGRRLAEAPVVGMGVEPDPRHLERVSSSRERQEILRGRMLPTEYFVTVGRKEAGKGVPQLAEWYARSRSSSEGAIPPLVFVGEGDDRLIPDSPDFIDLGYLPELEKLAVMAGAQATINLSPNESFSFVVMESWLCGTPVIVSDDCAVTRGHCHRSGGGLAVSGEGDLLAALSAFSDGDTRAVAGTLGREYVQEHYSWDVVTDRFVRALEVQ